MFYKQEENPNTYQIQKLIFQSMHGKSTNKSHSFFKIIDLVIIFYFPRMSATRGKDSLPIMLRLMMRAHCNKYAAPLKAYCNSRLYFRRNWIVLFKRQPAEWGNY
ncbi:MAG TPA: hypothetical protein DEB70_03770 [Planctomycetaceae bacterium]|nr:hypothetical protein [Planctomycetaceae bacterium]